MRSAEIFKALSDPLRLRMIYLLTCCEELCVCHFIDVLEQYSRYMWKILAPTDCSEGRI